MSGMVQVLFLAPLRIWIICKVRPV